MPVLAVLVRTHNPGNLGAAARAARNFGAELALLGPRTDPAHPDAISFASGAEELLRKVKILGSFDELAARADSVVALSSLRGRVSRGLPPPITFKEISSSLRHGRRVALVFGPERGGLTTAELQACDARLTIPTAPDLPTLNVAQAVVATLTLLYPFEASSRRRRETAPPGEQPAPTKDVRRLLSSLKETLSSAGYPGRGHSREVIAEIESFVKRGKPTAREVTLLLGALAAVRRGLGVSPSKPRG
ncbi:MAG TPA: TrmH family RNA methyltransferase [Thermoanaerobaculia bacterium]|nr:TrmH family RNA methyltransferase [Thermoanaerobaculia bacterium]